MITAIRTVDSGDTLFWIIVTVLLLLYCTRSFISMLLRNPFFVAIFIFIIIAIYIIVSAVNIAFGVGESIDNAINNLAEVIK